MTDDRENPEWTKYLTPIAAFWDAEFLVKKESDFPVMSLNIWGSGTDTVFAEDDPKAEYAIKPRRISVPMLVAEYPWFNERIHLIWHCGYDPGERVFVSEEAHYVDTDTGAKFREFKTVLRLLGKELQYDEE